MNTSNQVVRFLINKELDIKNYFIAFNAYKRNLERGFSQYKSDFLERLTKLKSEDEIRAEIEQKIAPLYEQKEKLDSLADDINAEWAKMEKNFLHRLEQVHGFPIPFKSVRGILSSANKFGYNTNEAWFATDMLKNKFAAIDTAIHELMHFMFHFYFDEECKKQGLSQNQMWDVKESFTVLLNSEFADFQFQPDVGYGPNEPIREVIKKSWEKNKNFSQALKSAITFVLKA